MKVVSGIQVLRAVAALSVALAHFSIGYLQMTGGSGEGPLYPLSAGVDLFFVISGFVMIYSSEDLFGKPGASLIFTRHRLARIVPIYWVTSTIAICIMGLHYDLRSIAGSYLFIPFVNENGSLNPLYGVGWTLNFEMYFYAVFAGCLFFRKIVALLVLCGVFLSAVAIGHFTILNDAAFIVWTDPIIVEFLFGALIAVLYRNGVVLPIPLRLAIPAVAVVAIFQFHVPELPSHYRWAQQGIPAALIVAAFVLGTQKALNGSFGTMLAQLGDSSYSLYLLHIIVLLIIFGHHATGTRALFAELSAGYFATIALSVMTYRCFERPLTKWLRFSMKRNTASARNIIISGA